jgi:hypothetical protein
MKKILFAFTSLLASICTYSQSLAPEVIASSGDYFTSADVKLNWTLGEMVTETFISGNILTQGFQQSDYLIVSIAETEENKQISVYPNPFSDRITINTGDFTGLKLQVFDLQGKILIEKTIEKSNKQIDFSAFGQGFYLIKVSDKSTLLKTFKIQKINN